MKTFTAFLFALLFCFNAFAWPKSYHPVSFSDEIIQKDVDTYNEEMKKCDQTLNKDTKAAKNTGQMIKSNQKFRIGENRGCKSRQGNAGRICHAFETDNFLEKITFAAIFYPFGIRSVCKNRP